MVKVVFQYVLFVDSRVNNATLSNYTSTSLNLRHCDAINRKSIEPIVNIIYNTYVDSPTVFIVKNILLSRNILKRAGKNIRRPFVRFAIRKRFELKTI